MFSNCTVEKIIHENVEDLVYVNDIKYIIMILFVLVGLKFCKQCQKRKRVVQLVRFKVCKYFQGSFLFVFIETE